MPTSSTDHRGLLSAGFWFAALTAGLAGAYGLSADSAVALALACQLAMIAVMFWAVGDVHRKRDLTAAGTTVQISVLASVAAFVGLVVLFQLLQQTLGAAQESGGAAFGAVCLGGAFGWLVLGRAFRALPPGELPEAEALSFACREVQWAFFLAAGALFGMAFYVPLAVWTGRLLYAWVLALCLETLLRSIAPIVIPPSPGQTAVPPTSLWLREAVFAAGNPIGSMLRTVETRFGISVRSSWAITFVKRTALPLLALLVLLFWASTALSVVEMDQMGVREQFGRVSGEPLPPGLHFTLPWPCGRIRAFSVKTVRQAPIGFVEQEPVGSRKEPAALLWTRSHTKEEFALVLGGGTELVVVNALLYYKIAEDPDGFMDYVYRQAAPEEALVAFAYRALTEETRGHTLDEVLSADRTAFARRLADSVRRQAREARLGLEVVDLALINLHPPIEAAGSYLDVINARLAARRRVTEAEGKKVTDLLAAQTNSASAVAAARVEASRRITDASSQVAEFTALAEAVRVAPATNRYRLWTEALEKTLADQRLTVIDRALLTEGGELLLDTRRFPIAPLPSLPAKAPAPGGAKKP